MPLFWITASYYCLCDFSTSSLFLIFYSIFWKNYSACHHLEQNKMNKSKRGKLGEQTELGAKAGGSWKDAELVFL